jgi:acetylornithine deacetylase
MWARSKHAPIANVSATLSVYLCFEPAIMTQVSQLLSDLVAIDSVNPDLVPGAVGESRVATYIADWLTAAGLDVHMYDVTPGRPNVVAIAWGKGDGRTLMLNGHIDTVGVTGMSEPHKPRLHGGRLYGRGAYDMKCGIAACMVAMAKLKHAALPGDVIFSAVMDEEYAGAGTLDIAQRYKADAAIVTEPTSLAITIAHKGFVWFDITTHGVAGHGSRPELGVDAIVKIGRVLTELERLDHRLRLNPTHPLLASGSIHASLIKGGQELSSYPAECSLQVERRLVPGETPESAQAELQAILDGCAAHDTAFKATLVRGLDRAPMNTDPTHPIIGLLQTHTTALTGKTPTLTGAPYWTDAASLSAAGIPSVLFGAHGEGAHAAEEWVDLNSVEHCARIYEHVARDFCGRTGE